MAYCEYVAYCPHCDISIELTGNVPPYVEGAGSCWMCSKKLILIFRKSAKNRARHRQDCGSSANLRTS
ncbi:Uncharacterised protein [Serratia fonticola]|uniref:Uncharacterized protein n=1 Tax=Serratia fonticola TaxID=47917 RepID=A0A4U9VY37_SERFO|nr:Uncharacterised protein [Serratia fonticola]VTR48681.1 Uncharacterised protein [Serratia fonticola]